MPNDDLKVIHVVNRCKHKHIDYLRSLAEQVPRNRVIVSYLSIPEWIIDKGILAPDRLLPELTVLNREHMREGDLDLDNFAAVVEQAVKDLNPHIVHVLPYLHDHLVITIRRVLERLGHPAAIVYETRDPSGLLGNDLPEEQGLRAADGYIFVSEEMADYVFNRYLFDPAPYLVIRQSEFYSRRGEFSEKLSQRDGKAHVVLMGTFSDDRGDQRHYEHFIRQFLLNTRDSVLHAHSHQPCSYLDSLETELGGRFFNHPTIPEVIVYPERYTPTASHYDFNLVAHVLWRDRNARELLRYCNPTKATSPLVLADLPFLCSSHYRGIAELVDRYECGFVYRSWDDLNTLFTRRDRWPDLVAGAEAAARDLCLEAQAGKVREFYDTVLRKSQST